MKCSFLLFQPNVIYTPHAIFWAKLKTIWRMKVKNKIRSNASVKLSEWRFGDNVLCVLIVSNTIYTHTEMYFFIFIWPLLFIKSSSIYEMLWGARAPPFNKNKSFSLNVASGFANVNRRNLFEMFEILWEAGGARRRIKFPTTPRKPRWWKKKQKQCTFGHSKKWIH